jgi:CBS domain-containing protein
MLVRYVMDRKVVMVREEATLEEVYILMRRYHLHDFPVVDTDANLKGMLYAPDLLKALYPKMQALEQGMLENADMEDIAHYSKNKLVSKVMRKKVMHVTGDEHLLKVGAKMLEQNVTRVPVTRDGKVVGLISEQQIFHEVMSQSVKKLPPMEDVELTLDGSEPEGEDEKGKRKFKRVALEMLMAYKLTNAGEKGPAMAKGSLAQVMNMSAGGFLIRTKEKLPLQEMVDTAFDLFKKDQPIKRLCRIVRCVPAREPGNYDIGLMLLAVNPEEREQISQYLTDLDQKKV